MKKSFLLLIILFSMVLGVRATPTKLVVRVKSKDAKFIGTGIGGAYVVIKNNLTGEVLSKGLTTGSSGSTELLLQTPLKRGQAVTDNKTAKFEATIDITDPLFVDVEVVAPVNRKNAAIKGSAQLWLIPGKDIGGEGLIIELPGYVLDIIQPTTHETIKADSLKNGIVHFKASLTMLCGCTITKGGVWDADEIDVVAIIKKEGITIKEVPLQLTGKPNIFEGALQADGKGNYQVTVYAYGKKNNNTGVDTINFTVQ
ncbi:MAG TPA: hypothetical protein PKC39_10885 [Ferruginibacter sp.]|nr:hypothetical protein [Ferruginibacter sp.]HMP21454.1 hypothetical protein [Ferruginibacter sp.]